MSFSKALNLFFRSVAIVPGNVGVPPSLTMYWTGCSDVPPRDWLCGYCGKDVGGNKGWLHCDDYDNSRAAVMVCPRCDQPSILFEDGTVVPPPLPGRKVNQLPEAVAQLHYEARATVLAGAYSASVMVCRTLLVHIAVHEGAKLGLKFVQYVDWLEEHHYCPPKGREWVDFIRQRGNDANHEIQLMTREDAELVLKFTESLLRHAYDLPARLPSKPPTDN